MKGKEGQSTEQNRGHSNSCPWGRKRQKKKRELKGIKKEREKKKKKKRRRAHLAQEGGREEAKGGHGQGDEQEQQEGERESILHKLRAGRWGGEGRSTGGWGGAGKADAWVAGWVARGMGGRAGQSVGAERWSCREPGAKTRTEAQKVAEPALLPNLQRTAWGLQPPAARRPAPAAPAPAPNGRPHALPALCELPLLNANTKSESTRPKEHNCKIIIIKKR